MNFIRVSGNFFSDLYSELGNQEVEQKGFSNKSIGNSHDNNLTSLDYSFVIKNELATIIIEKIRDLVKGKTSPKDKMMPIRAAQDAGVIRRPTYSEIKKAFGDDFIANSSFHNYTDPTKEPFDQDNSFKMLKEEFKKLIN